MPIQELILECNNYINHGINGRGIGLPNIAATCWLNSIIQLIIHSKVIMNYLNRIKLQLMGFIEFDSDIRNIYNIIGYLEQFKQEISTGNNPNSNSLRNISRLLSNLIGHTCQIGRYQDADEMLGLFFDKLNLYLYVNSQDINYLILEDFLDENINDKISELKSLINVNNNIFEYIYYLKYLKYNESCITLDNSVEKRIKGTLNITAIKSGFITLLCNNIANISIQNLVDDFQTLTLSDNFFFPCGGSSINNTVKLKLSDNSEIIFPINGNPDNITNLRYEFINNNFHYTYSNISYTGRVYSEAEKNPDDDWVFSKKLKDLLKDIKIIIKLCNGIVFLEDIEIIPGESWIEANQYEQYDLFPTDEFRKTLFLKLKRPINLHDSTNLNVNESIFLENNSIKKRYILIGGTINVNLSRSHYISFVRRNNKYWLHDDSSPGEGISLNSQSIRKTSTFLLYEQDTTYEDLAF